MHIDDLNLTSEVISLIELLEESRIVGGYVRDIIRFAKNRIVQTDLDLATVLKPEEVIKKLNNFNIRVIPTGLKHGTVTAVLPSSQQIEITTLREDLFCDGRHADISFSSSWLRDSCRRDFTMNALYLDLNGKVYDYHHGLKDLKQEKVVFIGDYRNRILEDYLRILRYFRFCSSFSNYSFDYHSQNISDMSYLLKHISKERIRSEMFKLLANPFCPSTLIFMKNHDVLKHVGLSLEKIEEEEIVSLALSENYIINLAAILRKAQWQEEQISSLAKQWNLSKKERETLKFLITLQTANDREIIYRYDLENYQLYVKMQRVLGLSDNKAQIKEEKMIFPLSGHDLLSLPIKKTKIGIKLKEMEDLWIKSDFQMTKKEMLKKIIDSEQ